MDTTFSLTNKTKGKLPRLPFVDIKNAVLGKTYTLSLVIVGTKTIKTLNSTYRGKHTPTDILSFSLSEKEGEIYINPNRARVKAKQFGRTYENYLAFVFIHGLYHLKGHDHGEKMETLEMKTRTQFKI